MTTREQGTFQMLWDCPACGTEKLLGLDHRYCPACGSPQDPERRYFPKPGEEVAAEGHVFSGADRVCPACGTPNGGKAACCGSCGSPLEGAAAARTRKDQAAATPGAFAADSAAAARDEAREARRAAEAARVGAGAPEPAKKRSAIPAVVGGVALVLVAGVVLAMCWKKPVQVEATGHSWERTIEVEAFQEVRDSAWCDAMPADASGVTRTREQRDTRKVPDGETCTSRRVDNGDGTFRQVEDCETKYREEPVMDDRCAYTVQRWTKRRDAKLTGGSLADTPRWPENVLERPGTCLGCEREGERTEAYTVFFRASEGADTFHCAWDQARWAATPLGARFEGKARVIGASLDCDSLVAGN